MIIVLLLKIYLQRILIVLARRKRNESPERQALREMMSGYLKDNPVRNGNDVNSIMREMMSVILEGALDGELD